ncbi:hypothetical protein [Gordonia humi]|uniref:NADPH-dependent glutamate synthase beta subunit-like oxidoreductase n=1 Tax=Gordonia humi TaxID=686429 RepID=A0A840F455_9ACTN|nr:hypothetical protein [Gordonia humi]MBB4134357.1 NADPH-dependent glutamate synthase beta subunit-like oxidoreductase [Gordonia humi]
MSTAPNEKTWEVAAIGGGPAGLNTALVLAEERLAPAPRRAAGAARSGGIA